MKRKIVLHADVMRVLAAKRQDLPLRPEFERALSPPPVKAPLFVYGYDLDELLEALYDVCYKYDGEDE